MRIVKLSEEVINQIAAGEVVENPASIAKELIENSLDAGATRIQIEMEEGGVMFLSVEDNGCGMNREEALICLERYATSKIRSTKDLDRLTTMGFRGEALAAIGSVCRLHLKTSDGFIGTQIEAAGGQVVRVEPCARNCGTTIAISSLFFNTPARKKFLKSTSANAAAVIRAVETIALAHPDVSFILKNHGKEIFRRESEGWKERIEGIIDPMPLLLSDGPLRGLLGLPETAKSHRKEQYLFINRRPVFSPLISRAVKMGYGTRLSEQSHPSFVLFLEIAPDLIDVNVHPQKKEVRFGDEKGIFHLFERAVEGVFHEERVSFKRPLTFSKPEFTLAEEKSPYRFELPLPLEKSLPFDLPVFDRPIAIINHCLLLSRNEKDFILVDLPAAHAKVLSSSLHEKKGAVQRLLYPISVDVEDETIEEQLLELGIECHLVGRNKLAIDALPVWIEPSSFETFLAHWQEGKKMDSTIDRYCRVLKKRYSLEEGMMLWNGLSHDIAPLGWNGKPIWIQITEKNLNLLF